MTAETCSVAVRASAVPARDAWLLFAAFAGHNLEEVLVMPAFMAAGGAAALPAFMRYPSPGAFAAAVAAVTVVALVMTLVGTHRPPRAWKRAVLVTLAAVLVLNAVVPHVPAAVVVGGYVPGLVTALTVTLPTGLWYLRRTRGVGQLPGRSRSTISAAAVSAGALLLPLVVLGASA